MTHGDIILIYLWETMR